MGKWRSSAIRSDRVSRRSRASARAIPKTAADPGRVLPEAHADTVRCPRPRWASGAARRSDLTASRGARAQALAQFLRPLRTREESFQKRTQIQSGAPDHDGQVAPLVDFPQA